MMKYIALIVFALITLNLNAQNVEFKASNFKDKKEAYKKAVEAIKKGNE